MAVARIVRLLLVAALPLLLQACSDDDSTNSDTTNSNSGGDVEVQDLTVQSDSWPADGDIPLKYVRDTHGGQNVSPNVKWSTTDGINWFLVVIVDHHPVAHDWIHWVVLLPGDATEIEEGASGHFPAGIKEYMNSFGNEGYDGPAPPDGPKHDYHIVVMGLTNKPDLPEQPTWKDILDATEKPLVGKGELVAYYGTGE